MNLKEPLLAVSWGLFVVFLPACASEGPSEPDSTDTDTETDTDTGTADPIAWESMVLGADGFPRMAMGQEGEIYAFGNGSAVRFDGDSWTSFTAPDGGWVEYMCASQGGNVWLFSNTTLYFGPLDGLKPVAELSDDQWMWPYVQNIWCDTDGSVVIVGSYEVQEWEGDKPPPVNTLFERYQQDGTSESYAGKETARLTAVCNVEDELVVVGRAGAILRFDGVELIPMESGVKSTLFDVSGHSFTDLFAVGEAGTVLRYNGKDWESISVDGLDKLNVHSIVTDSTDTFIAASSGYYPDFGGSDSTSKVFLLQSDTFQELSPPDGDIRSLLYGDGTLWGAGWRDGSLVATFSDEQWQDNYYKLNLGNVDQVAVGDNGTAAAVGLRNVILFDGAQWRVHTREDINFTDVTYVGGGRFFASAYNFDEKAPAIYEIVDEGVVAADGFDDIDAHIVDLETDSNGNVWAAGWSGPIGDGESQDEALLWHWDGESWNDVTPNDDYDYFASVSVADDTVFVATCETMLVGRDGEWTVYSADSEEITAVQAVSANEVYVGRDPILLFDGESLQPIKELEDVRAFDFTIDSEGHLLIAGDAKNLGEDEEEALLIQQTDSGWVTVASEPDVLFFGSVDSFDGQSFALDTYRVWWNIPAN